MIALLLSVSPVPSGVFRLPQPVAHEFRYLAEKELKRVNLAGTFNNWNKDAWPMKLDTDGRTWRFAAQLEPGKHLYKFVLDGETWITDPKARKNEDDGGGNVNSVLMLLPEGYEKPASIGDGALTTTTLKHEQVPPYLNWDRGVLEIRVRCRPNDAQRVELWTTNKKIIPMKLASTDEFYAMYTAKIPWDRKKELDYLFSFWDKKAGANLGANGSSREDTVIPFRLKPSEFKPITVSPWPEKTVVYQIFPDRFENGDPKNDPAGVQSWNGAPTYSNFFGGDFVGVEKRIPYLKSLGIGAIYFNPIFKSPSNHGYETIDYKTVEPRFGSNDEFIRLTRSLKGAGIRTVLDGVFNHCATTFAPFADLVENGPDSKYKDWFYPKSFPIEVRENPPYEAWYGFPSMPKVNLANPEAASYMLDVPKFWNQQAEIAGWRLDVANEVPMDYWRQFRKVVKSIRPDMWIVGEHWGDSNPWLKGDQWDASMNYPWREAMLQFFATRSISASEFQRKLVGNYNLYVPQVSRNQLNLLSSHDTPRFLTLAKGDRKMQMLAATVQMAWPGTPSIYYGEEIGMEGGRDPENRRGMEWDKVSPQNEILSHYKKLVGARIRSRVLQSGEPMLLKADDSNQSLAFARVLDQDVAVTAVNRSDKPVRLEIDLKGKGIPVSPTLRKQGFDNVLGGGRIPVSPKGSLSIRLEPKSSALLVAASAVSGRRLAVSSTANLRLLPANLALNSSRLTAIRRQVAVRTAHRQLPTANPVPSNP